ncbi:zinc finger protein weckle-like [Galleria mellonella]|uniref:Zinc finger protein weckle-like n=1 Tax=Galleria mellonella TaxID=7137 RepID=A0A6J1WSZ5_GALME|nr:zinc finger protein weckle-like [Galleria mellonella]
MNDFANLEKTIVRELSCRLCLCNDVVKLKPLNAEVKRKIKRFFDIIIRTDDNLPKAICHDCLQQVSLIHLYTIKVERTQKFLDFHKMKNIEEKRDQQTNDNKMQPAITQLTHDFKDTNKKINNLPKSPPTEFQQGDAKPTKQIIPKNKSPSDMKFMEAMPLEEFAKTESVDKSLLNSTSSANKTPVQNVITKEASKKGTSTSQSRDLVNDPLDPVVLINGRPAKQGAALDKQITLFYKMECCICHEKGFNFRSLMKHYKDRHGVPGYVTCCEKKFHYFYPKKIIEHMAFHLQPNIFMCPSCHQNFQSSQELIDHQSNGGRSDGKIICPRCSERFPTYHELGWHVITHRTDKQQCDYCGKILKHHHRKKTVNQMENVILCSQCVRTLKNIEKQEKDIKEKLKVKNNDAITLQKYQKFRQAMGLSGDEESSTD